MTFLRIGQYCLSKSTTGVSSNADPLIFFVDNLLLCHLDFPYSKKQDLTPSFGIGYAATNGHEYKSMAELMIRDGKMSRDRLSMPAMIEYFKAHPNEVPEYIKLNPRFVFFRTKDGEPRGSINEPVTTFRSIATDKSVYPRACLAFLSTTLPRENGSDLSQAPYTGFALDQDTGGAIRAPGRCDIYMGQGDTAGRLAGQTCREGRLYYLFKKPEYQGSVPVETLKAVKMP